MSGPLVFVIYSDITHFLKQTHSVHIIFAFISHFDSFCTSNKTHNTK